MCQPNGRGFSYLTVCLALLLSPALAQAGSVVPTDDANTLANALLRPNSGLTLVSASLSGPAGATATPSLGTGGSGDGILLTTGLASEAVGPPTLTASTDLGDRLWDSGAFLANLGSPPVPVPLPSSPGLVVAGLAALLIGRIARRRP